MSSVNLNGVDAAVAKEIKKQKAKAEAELATQRQSIFDELFAKEREIANDFIGWKIGIRGNAMGTDNAGVTVYDPLYGISSAAPEAPKSAPAWPLLLAAAFIGYQFFRKGKKRS